MIRIPAVGIGDLSACDVMTSPVVVCREEMLLDEAASQIAVKEITGMPVVDAAGELVGMISERDLAHALGSPLVRLAVRRPHRRALLTKMIGSLGPSARRVRDVMTDEPIVARPDTPLRTLAEIMVKEQISRIPIVRHHELVGIVTKGDVLAALAGMKALEINLEQPQTVTGSGVLDADFHATRTAM